MQAAAQRDNIEMVVQDDERPRAMAVLIEKARKYRRCFEAPAQKKRQKQYGVLRIAPAPCEAELTCMREAKADFISISDPALR